ncbi:hypothetical protein N0V95_000371 [Ascochyta clinopodiicola]|nr:hypothetical protein N0V95_000371 [Ascochyta clinopodiicola]
MSFGEFVRSKSDDVAMSMLKTIINQLLENEDQTAKIRENIYEANGADEKVESNILNGRGNNLETNGLEGVNDSVAADGDGAGMSGGVSVVNITGI